MVAGPQIKLSSVCVQEGWKGKVWWGSKGATERLDFQIFPEHLPRLARTGIIWLVGCASPLIPILGQIQAKPFVFRLPGSLSELWAETVWRQACVILTFVPLLRGKKILLQLELDVICHFFPPWRGASITDLPLRPRHGAKRGHEYLLSRKRN